MVVANLTVVVKSVTFSTNQVDEPLGLVSLAGSERAILSPITGAYQVFMMLLPRDQFSIVKVCALTNIIRSTQKDQQKSFEVVATCLHQQKNHIMQYYLRQISVKRKEKGKRMKTYWSKHK